MSIIVVPGNGQELLGLPDSDSLKLININIKECHTNMTAVQGFDTKQEKVEVLYKH